MDRRWKYEILLYWSEEDHAYLAEIPLKAGDGT